jgi:hypothetical protein
LLSWNLAELAQLHLIPNEQQAGLKLSVHCLLLFRFDSTAQVLLTADAIDANCAGLAAAVLAAHQTSHPR